MAIARFTTLSALHQRSISLFICGSNSSRSLRQLSTRPDHPVAPEPCHGTVPQHDSMLFLHTNKPPISWPARIEPMSPLLRDMKRKMKARNGAVTFAYTPSDSGPNTDTDEYTPWDENGPESYPATLYAPGFGPIAIPSLDSTTNLTSVLGSPPSSTTPSVHFYVCTHGSRDCRCGDVGGNVVDALRERVAALPQETRDGIRISEVAHVGGHVWAANVLVYPFGDWFGNVRPNDVPALLDVFTQTSPEKVLESTPLFAKHWRGRMGMTQEEQLALHSTRVGTPSETPPKDADHFTIPFMGWDGHPIPVKAVEGQSLMDAAKAAGVPSIEGVCGGQLECATCHVYIPTRQADGIPAPVPPISDSEEDMLEYAIGRKDRESRLGCQIPVTKELIDWIQQGGQIKLPKF